MRQTISFPGMARSLSMAGTRDGALEHVEGMRLENGAWVATSDNDAKISNTNGFDDVFIHTIDTAKVFVAYHFQTGDLYYWTGVETPKTIFLGDEFDVTIKSLGSILVVMASKAGSMAKMHYFEYNITTATYLNVTLDETESVDFEFQSVTQIDEGLIDGYLKLGVSNTGLYSEIKASLDVIISDWQIDGKLEGWVFVSCAYMLYDGTYFRPSTPKLMYFGTGNTDRSPFAKYIESGNSSDPATYAAEDGPCAFWRSNLSFWLKNYWPGKLQVRVKNNASIQALVDIGKIVGITVFASPVLTHRWAYGVLRGHHPTYWFKNANGAKSNFDAPLTYSDLAKLEVTNAFEEGNMDINDWYKWIGLFKVGTLNIDQLSETWVDAPKCNYNSISQQEQFPVDLARHTISAKTSFIYNNRLLLGNVSTKLYGDTMKTEDVLGITPATSSIYEVFLIFSVKTSNELLYVKTIPTPITLNDMGGGILGVELPNYRIVYPDSRAFEATIVYHNINTDQYTAPRKIKLTPSETMNIAYYVDALTTTTNFMYVLFNVAQAPITYNPTITDTNRIQASETGNPYLFPARYSYSVGTTKVIAMAATTEPTSTGQFGQYPVIVFTGNGVWALELGNGEVFVQSIVPMTSDVAMDDNLVSNSSAVFFKTKHGIFALSGRESKNLSIPLVAACDTSLDNNAQLNGVLAGMFYTVPAGTPIPVDRTSMLEYISLQGTRLAIDPKTNELLVYNRLKNFTYTFGLDTQAWYTKNRGYISILNDYSRILAIPTSDDSAIFAVDQLKTNTNVKSFRLETRPIFAGKGLTGIGGLKVEVFTKGATANCLIVALLATNGDGSKWGMVAGKKVMLASGGTVSEIVFGHIPGKWRAFKLVVAGVRMYSAEILGVVFDTNERMNQKIR